MGWRWGPRRACLAAACTLKQAEMLWWVDGRRPRFILSAVAMVCRAGHRGSLFFLAQPALGVLASCLLHLPRASPVLSLQSNVRGAGGGDGEGPRGIYMYQCSGRKQTACSREVIQKTSVKETLSMRAFRLRTPNGLRVPPSPPCHLSDPFRGESRGVGVSSLSASRAPLCAVAPASAGLTCFFELVNLEREKGPSAPASLQPIL